MIQPVNELLHFADRLILIEKKKDEENKNVSKDFFKHLKTIKNNVIDSLILK